jgi:hypothetical protein
MENKTKESPTSDQTCQATPKTPKAVKQKEQ